MVDVELVRFEQDPNNAKILNNIFRLVHTIKGTCGFLNLPRLEALTHAAEALMGKFRDGARVTGEAVTLVLATIDRVKALLDQLEQNEAEPAGDDRDLIAELDRVAAATVSAHAAPCSRTKTSSTKLERAFRDTPGPRYQGANAAPQPAAASAGAKRSRAERAEQTPRTAATPPAATTSAPTARSRTSRSACTSTRSNI